MQPKKSTSYKCAPYERTASECATKNNYEDKPNTTINNSTVLRCPPNFSEKKQVKQNDLDSCASQKTKRTYKKAQNEPPQKNNHTGSKLNVDFCFTYASKSGRSAQMSRAAAGAHLLVSEKGKMSRSAKRHSSKRKVKKNKKQINNLHYLYPTRDTIACGQKFTL
jgi:hypothetical protein